MKTKESLRSEAEIWAVGEEDKRRGMPLPGPLPTSQIEWAVSRCRKGNKEVNILVVYCKAWVSYQSLIWFQVAFSSAVLKALSPILPVHSLVGKKVLVPFYFLGTTAERARTLRFDQLELECRCWKRSHSGLLHALPSLSDNNSDQADLIVRRRGTNPEFPDHELYQPCSPL